MQTKATEITKRSMAAVLMTAALLGVGVSAGCRGERTAKPPRQFIPDMDDSPKWKPQSESQFFADNRTMRPPVAGTVAFGATERLDDSRGKYLRADDTYYSGTSGYNTKGEPVFLETIPVEGFAGWPAEAREGEASTDFLRRREAFIGEMIRHGQQRFNIYCSVCHGYTGDGQGMVGTRWTTPVANFHDPKYFDKSIPQGQDGYLFNVIRHGVPFPNVNNEALRMPGYGHSVNEEDAWAIVAYLRVLQQTRTGIANVPEADRAVLRTIPQPAPKAKPEAAKPANGEQPQQNPATPPTGTPGGSTPGGANP